MIVQEITKKIEPVLRKHDVSFAGLFGSRARGEERIGSDVDLLVKFSKQKGLLELVGLERDLSEALDMKVDVVTEGALSPLLKPEVFKNLQPLYGQR
jgi:predicted nucleotidyltransferase